MIIPTVIEKEYASEKAYDIYSRLLKDRIILLNGEVNDESANIIIAQLFLRKLFQHLERAMHLLRHSVLHYLKIIKILETR